MLCILCHICPLICEARERREGKVVEERRAALQRPRPAWIPLRGDDEDWTSVVIVCSVN